MGLNIGESTAVFTVGDYLLDKARRPELGLPSEEQLLEAMVLLADAAYKKMQAGYNGDYVREHWKRRRVTHNASTDSQTDGKAGS